MNVLRTGMAVALAALGVLAWRAYAPEGGVKALAGKVLGAAVDAAPAGPSTRGFVDVPLPDGQSGHGVVIFAPVNCPSDAAQRAEALARRLESEGIPFVRSQNANFSSISTQEEANRVLGVMNGDVPVVFVRQRARANPDADDVVAEYRGGGAP